MKHGLIPSFRPKDLSQKLDLIKDEEKSLLATFKLVNDVEGLDYNLTEGLLVRLKEFVDSEWGAKRLGPRSEFENARNCLLKRNLVGALLSLRYSAYWLGFHVINKREDKIRAEICSSENHVSMIRSLASVSESFYELYKQLHFAQKWDVHRVEAAMIQVQAVLDDCNRET